MPDGLFVLFAVALILIGAELYWQHKEGRNRIDEDD